MNITYLAPPLVASCIGFAILLVAQLKGARGAVRNIFSALVVCIILWGIAIFFMRSSSDPPSAVPWSRVATFFIFATFVFYYHLSLAITTLSRQRAILAIAYISLIAVAALSPAGLFVRNVSEQSYGYAPVLGEGIFVMYPLGLGLFFMAFYNLFRQYRTLTLYEERNRHRYLIIAMCLPFIGLILETFPTIYPTAIFGSILFCIIAAIAIIRYQLLDIRIVIRKGLAYTMMSAIVAIPYVSAIYFVNEFVTGKVTSIVANIVLVVLLAVLLQPLWSQTQKAVDRIFYGQRYRHLKALNEFSRETQSVVSSKQVGLSFLEHIIPAMGSSVGYLLLLELKTEAYTLVSYVGTEDISPKLKLNRNSALVQWLSASNKALRRQELTDFFILQAMTEDEERVLDQLNGMIYVPIKQLGRTVGILIVGEKTSGEQYSQEDLELLITVCSQVATNIENARLYYEEIRTKERLRESQEKYRQLFEGLPIPAFRISLEEGIIIDCNQALADFLSLGNSEEAIDGQVVLANYFYRETWSEMIEQLKKNSVVRELEMNGTRKNGSEFNILMSCRTNLEKGYIEGSLIDVTERTRAEEKEKELQRQLNLSSRLASIGQLAAGVAHEINNPLTGILAFSTRLLRKSKNEKFSQDLNIIHGEAQRAAKVVENLLTFARRRESKRDYSDINDVVQKTIDLRAYELKTSNIEMVTDLTPNLPEIIVDFYQIQEVFLNIILNAEQAMVKANGGGKLVIKTQEMNNCIKISFTDDGPGIPTKHIDKLFDPFFTTKGEKYGTGLGLSLSYGIVTKHGGNIYVRSKPRKGATFIVELPITSGTAETNKVVNA